MEEKEKIHGYYGGITGESALIFEGDTVKISWCHCDLVLVDKEKNIYQIKNCPANGQDGCRSGAPRDYYEGEYVYEFWNDYMNKYCVGIGPSIKSVLDTQGRGMSAFCQH